MIESITGLTGRIAFSLVWIVFGLGLFNVVTRYVARFIERDIIIGEVFDLQWMLFGALVLLGLNYGVREGVNPRIDFWWANFSNRRKAILDLLVHVFLFLPFLVVAMRTCGRGPCRAWADRSTGPGRPGRYGRSGSNRRMLVGSRAVPSS